MKKTIVVFGVLFLTSAGLFLWYLLGTKSLWINGVNYVEVSVLNNEDLDNPFRYVITDQDQILGLKSYFERVKARYRISPKHTRRCIITISNGKQKKSFGLEGDKLSWTRGSWGTLDIIIPFYEPRKGLYKYIAGLNPDIEEWIKNGKMKEVIYP